MEEDEFVMMMEREAGLQDHVLPVCVGFGLHPLLDEEESEKRGHPYYRDAVFFRCTIPGDRNSVVFQPATEAHKKRFPQAWAKFQSDRSQAVEGTPLTQWPQVTRSDVLNYRAIGINTVEELAAVHDGHIDKLGAGGRDLRAKAKAWLKQAKDNAALHRMAKKEEEMAATIAALQAQIRDLTTRVDGRRAS